MDLGLIRGHRDPHLPMAGGGDSAGRTLRSALAVRVDCSFACVLDLWMLVIVTWAR
jgi:hypothetical protein